jgi:hypothetical protein
MGERHAEVALARLKIAVEDARLGNLPPLDTTPGVGPDRAPEPPVRASYPTVAEALDAFLDFQKAETSSPTFGWYKEKLAPVFQRYGGRRINCLT